MPAPSLVAAGIAVVGAGARIRLFLDRQSLWLDEAMLALNIGRRSFLHLLDPLSYDQAAPAIFLWAVKSFTLLFGMHELSMRAPALLAGILLPPLVWQLGRRVSDEATALVASGLVALSPILVAYSNDAKPYTLDAVATAALLILALRYRGDASPRNCALLIVAGALAIWSSFPAVFTLAAILAVLCIDTLDARDRRTTSALAIATAVWGATFAIHHAVVIARATEDSALADFWRGAMIDIATPGWTIRARVSIGELIWPFTSLTYRAQLLVSASSFVIGTAVLWRSRSWRTALLVVAPIAMGLSASAISEYPVVQRLALFASPVAAVVLALAVTAAWNAAAGPAMRVVIAGAAIGLFTTAFTIRTPTDSHQEGVRTMVEEFGQLRRGAPVYGLAGGVAQWACETTDWSHPDSARLDRYARVGSVGGYAFHYAPPRGTRLSLDGADTAWREAEGLVIVGRYTGMGYEHVREHVSPRPDEGWAASEVARLRAVADTGWFFGAHANDAETGALHRAIVAAGGRFLRQQSGVASFIWEVAFP